MIPSEILIGATTALAFGTYALSDANETAFKAFLLGNGFAEDNARANAIWTQAREFYYGDTGTATARPQRNPVNRFTSEAFQSEGLLPFFTSVSEMNRWNNQNPESEFFPRFNSGSDDVTFPVEYVFDGGLVGLAAIVCEGDFAYCWVLRDSQ